MRDYTPPAQLSEEQTEEAVGILARLAETEALNEWWAMFRRDDLAFTGVYPAGYDQSLGEITAVVPAVSIDRLDVEGSRRRNLERARLAIRHGVEEYDLELRLIADAIAERS